MVGVHIVLAECKIRLNMTRLSRPPTPVWLLFHQMLPKMYLLVMPTHDHLGSGIDGAMMVGLGYTDQIVYVTNGIFLLKREKVIGPADDVICCIQPILEGRVAVDSLRQGLSESKINQENQRSPAPSFPTIVHVLHHRWDTMVDPILCLPLICRKALGQCADEPTAPFVRAMQAHPLPDILQHVQEERRVIRKRRVAQRCQNLCKQLTQSRWLRGCCAGVIEVIQIKAPTAPIVRDG